MSRVASSRRITSKRHCSTETVTERGRLARRLCALSLLLVVCWSSSVSAFVFYFVHETGHPGTVTHSGAYSGSGGHLTMTVGINPSSPHAEEMLVPVLNAISTWNKLVGTTGNRQDLGEDAHDFESTVLQELGHALGLGHPNHNETDFTNAYPGDDGVFTLNAGFDGRPGTADDVRGDDVNLNWFLVVNNKPFVSTPRVDADLYTRDLRYLLAIHSFSAIAALPAAELAGVPNTVACMLKKPRRGIRVRSLSQDDVQAIRFTKSGFDGLEGTDDDYTIELRYVGLTTDADVLLTFVSGLGQPARTFVNGSRIGVNQYGDLHLRITSATVAFDVQESWYFNQRPPQGATGWQNGRNPLDTTNDGVVTPRDALVVINALSPDRGGSRAVCCFPGPDEYYVDVTGDGWITSLDALRVINYLGRQNDAGGQGEQIVDLRFEHAREALALDREHGFYVSTLVKRYNYYLGFSFNTADAKFLQSSARQWYYLTPTGALHRWNGSFGTSARIATLDADYYEHLELLHDAADSFMSVSND